MKIAVFYENIHEGVQASGQTMEDTLKRLQDSGMEMLYISADSWERDRRTLSGLLEKLDLPVEGMHAFCDFPREPDGLRYREIIDLAAECGAGNLLFVPGMLSTGNTGRDLDNIARGMRRAVEYGAARNIPVLMEDYDGLLAPYNCIAGLRWFLQSVEGLGCAFDTGNFIIYHEDELEAFELFADKIRTVHLKDRVRQMREDSAWGCLCADQKTEFACPIGSGYIRIAEILKRLQGRGYPGNVIVELYGCDPKYLMRNATDFIRWVKEQIG